MTEWEQRELFGRLDRIAELLEKIECNTNIKIGLDIGSEDGDFSVVNGELVPKPQVVFNVEAKIDEYEEKFNEMAESSRKRKIDMDRDEYRMYKENGGTMKWNEWHSKKRGKTKMS